MTGFNYMKGKGNKAIAEKLSVVLADTFVLYYKTHTFHWNVEGPLFKQLHDLFELQYNELWTSTDELAERIRALDHFAPLNFKEILKISSLKEVGQMPDAETMVQMLVDDNYAIVDSIHDAIKVCEDHGDEGTIDIMNARSKAHEKAAWMLKSVLK